MRVCISATSPNAGSELEQARPQTSGEEELQLQLALAMSREAAEQVTHTHTLRMHLKIHPHILQVWLTGVITCDVTCFEKRFH